MTKENDARAFRSVLLATDFSSVAQVAGQYAALLAQHYDAEMIAVHAFTLEQPALEAEELGHVRSMQRQHLERMLSETAKKLAPVAVRMSSVLEHGKPMHVIERVLEQHRPAVIVLGTHGGGAMERRFVGSVAEAILRTVHDPVLTVGPHVAMPSMDRLTFRHILFATDFSPAATHAASYAVDLARNFGSELDVLHVVSEDDAGKLDLLIQKEKEMMAAIGEHGSATSHPIPRLHEFVESGKIRERILRHACERGVDLIVLGAHHHSHLARHLRTGPALQVIIEASCPVLTVCAKE
jgi:nucleotide-binding universal stress UspA family protein